jgi:hypothetical protein
MILFCNRLPASRLKLLLSKMRKFMVGILAVRNSMCEMGHVVLNFSFEPRWNQFLTSNMILSWLSLR